MTHAGAEHLAMLALFVVGLVPAVVAGRRPSARTAGRWAGAGLGLVGVASTLLDVVTRYDVDVSLPFQLSDLAWMAASLALITRHRLAVACCFYWGLTLTLQAILTPSLAESFPDVRFFAFWVLHLGTIWAAVHLTWGVGLRPGWRDYAATIAVTLTWLVLTLGFNLVAGTNYGYLVRKPAARSALDLLGPWPVYVLVEVVVLAVLWAGLTAVVARRRANRAATA